MQCHAKPLPSFKLPLGSRVCPVCIHLQSDHLRGEAKQAEDAFTRRLHSTASIALSSSLHRLHQLSWTSLALTATRSHLVKNSMVWRAGSSTGQLVMTVTSNSGVLELHNWFLFPLGPPAPLPSGRLKSQKNVWKYNNAKKCRISSNFLQMSWFRLFIRKKKLLIYLTLLNYFLTQPNSIFIIMIR